MILARKTNSKTSHVRGSEGDKRDKMPETRLGTALVTAENGIIEEHSTKHLEREQSRSAKVTQDGILTGSKDQDQKRDELQFVIIANEPPNTAKNRNLRLVRSHVMRNFHSRRQDGKKKRVLPMRTRKIIPNRAIARGNSLQTTSINSLNQNNSTLGSTKPQRNTRNWCSISDDVDPTSNAYDELQLIPVTRGEGEARGISTGMYSSSLNPLPEFDRWIFNTSKYNMSVSLERNRDC